MHFCSAALRLPRLARDWRSSATESSGPMSEVRESSAHRAAEGGGRCRAARSNDWRAKVPAVDGDAAARFDGKFAQGGRDEQECKEEGKLVDCAVAQLDDVRAARAKVREREDLGSRLAARARRGLKRAVSRINFQSRSQLCDASKSGDVAFAMPPHRPLLTWRVHVSPPSHS